MLRERVVANVQIKFFNFLLVPLQTSLVAGVQERINVLTDDELEVCMVVVVFLLCLFKCLSSGQV
jgi:hypothetical protein